MYVFQAAYVTFTYPIKEFDNVLLLYKGRQIFFGSTARAKDYFTGIGFVCSERSTTADFLTSLTNQPLRTVRAGFENRVPRTPDEFAKRWEGSAERTRLVKEISEYQNQHPLGVAETERFRIAQAVGGW